MSPNFRTSGAEPLVPREGAHWFHTPRAQSPAGSDSHAAQLCPGRTVSAQPPAPRPSLFPLSDQSSWKPVSPAFAQEQELLVLLWGFYDVIQLHLRGTSSCAQLSHQWLWSHLSDSSLCSFFRV